MATTTLAGLRLSSEVDAAISGGTEMPKATRAWYNKVFLSVARGLLIHDQFGMPTTLPKNTGEQVIWRRWLDLATATVPLGEGVNPTGSTLAYENVLATVKWYGDWVGITDVVDFHHVDNVLSIATEKLARQAAETMDEITRDIINAGTSFLRVVTDGSNPTNGVGLRTTVNGVCTKAALDTAITTLESENAEKFRPMQGASKKVATQPLAPTYVGLIHPHVANGFVKALAGFATDDWIPFQKYASGGIAYEGEIGTYRNVRMIQSTKAKYWPNTGGGTDLSTTPTVAGVYRSTSGSLADVYSVLILAKEAFGVVKLAGAYNTYYNKAGGNSDPLHRLATAAWKAVKTAAILDDSKMIRIECAATW